MKAWTLTAAALAATLTLAGCAEDAPGVAATPEPVPGDPATYAPDGWPLQIGDKISDRSRWELESTFPGIGGVEAIHLVDGRTYGARFTDEAGAIPDGDWARQLDPGRRERLEEAGRLDERRFVYAGHFPEKPLKMAQHLEHQLPEHLRGKIEYEELRVTSVGRASHSGPGPSQKERRALRERKR